MIRVLNIHWGFIPGGVARYASLISNVSKIAPIEMKSICVKAPNWSFDRINASKLSLKIISISSRLDPSWIWKVRKIIRQEKPSLLFTYGFNGNFVAITANVGQGVPIVSSWHGKYVGTTLLQKLVSPLVNFLSDILLKYFVKNIVTVSDYSMNVLARKSIEKKKIIRIYNGIPPFNDDKSKVDRGAYHEFSRNEELLIGTACRLDSTKDLPTFLRAIRIVLKVNDRIIFIIWGDGPQKKFLIEMAKELKIYDNVKFMGYEPKIDQSLKFLDIFVLPSILENFSIALLEAMRAGLPIIATKVGGNPEAIEHYKHAILVPPRNPGALAEGMLKFAKNKNLRVKTGKAAQQRFKDLFTNKKMVAEIAKWLTGCAENVANK